MRHYCTGINLVHSEDVAFRTVAAAAAAVDAGAGGAEGTAANDDDPRSSSRSSSSFFRGVHFYEGHLAACVDGDAAAADARTAQCHAAYGDACGKAVQVDHIRLTLG